MDKFFHIRMLMGIILGLSITHLLKGLVKFVEHPGKVKAYWIHLLWVFYLFLLIAHFWWWEFSLHTITSWNFVSYFYLILYTACFFVNASLLFPEQINDYTGYEDYFYSRRGWFFGALGFTFLMDIIDTLLKGVNHMTHLGYEYLAYIFLHVIGCLLAMKVRDERFHGAFVIVVIIYQIIFIYRLYFTLES
jgi:hypothetical protein